eukprot:CAMPEP_0181446460 /NCGR_PEP_ID=MMETSP1110-20121109/26116_1 /TAXON_ID=174948 /ORGANISM="Symbiodinium sp., Strain CCMP421" /LENGTH=97 /DNA_ID=CAMNT_0023570539 /DNA_START=64 /DNA_END=358 /DNA_ORIENTATION=+
MRAPDAEHPLQSLYKAGLSTRIGGLTPVEKQTCKPTYTNIYHQAMQRTAWNLAACYLCSLPDIATLRAAEMLLRKPRLTFDGGVGAEDEEEDAEAQQ